MEKFSFNKFSENISVSSILAISQASIGIALGLFLSEKVSRQSRIKIANCCLITGICILSPFIASIIKRIRNNPFSKYRSSKDLESIRANTGFNFEYSTHGV